MLRGGGRDDRLGAMQEHKSLSDEFPNLVSGAVSSVASLSRLAPEFECAAALLVRTLQEGMAVSLRQCRMLYRQQALSLHLRL